jgi:hypothetical protein
LPERLVNRGVERLAFSVVEVVALVVDDQIGTLGREPERFLDIEGSRSGYAPRISSDFMPTATCAPVATGILSPYGAARRR